MDRMDSEKFSCCVCLDLLKDPVTIPCGHSYCLRCITAHWDEEAPKGLHSCPQCRRSFAARPELEKNIMLAALVAELQETELQADLCSAGAGDVACDVCSGRKLKAIRSCLVCRVSFCQEHLQPHHHVAQFQKHKLVEPSEKLQHISSRHDQVMKILEEEYEAASAAAERAEKQEQLEGRRGLIQRRIRDGEEDAALLQQEAGAINLSADEAVEDSEEIFSQLIRLLETLSRTEDHQQFLLRYASLPAAGGATPPSSIRPPSAGGATPPSSIRPPAAGGATPPSIISTRRFEGVPAAVSQLRDELQDVLTHRWTNISAAVADAVVLLSEPEPEPEPSSRAEFLQYFREITLDPNTAHTHVFLSEGNRRAAAGRQQRSSPSRDRFSVFVQALSREALAGRCYWEVAWRGGGVHVAVAYRDLQRARGPAGCGFGYNDRSWSLLCDTNGFAFWHDNVETAVSGPRCSRVGVYLDPRAGVLSFYAVSDTMTLLHRVHSSFTRPLHAGLRLLDYGVTAEFRCLERRGAPSDPRPPCSPLEGFNP